MRLSDLTVGDTIEWRFGPGRPWTAGVVDSLDPHIRFPIAVRSAATGTPIAYCRSKDVRLPKTKRVSARAPREPKSLRGAPPVALKAATEAFAASPTYANAGVLNTVLRGTRGPALSRPKEPKPWRSEEYLAFVRTFTCTFSFYGCDGSIEAHHHGKHPMGQKTDDSRAVPVCQRHHRALTEYKPITGGSDELVVSENQVNILTEWLKKKQEKNR